jgi:phosphosulfolactate synthase
MYKNFTLDKIPVRTQKPREYGFTMVMDKGLSLRETEDLIDVAGNYIDIVKLGWATSYVTPNLKEKLDIYRAAGIPTYFGGTLFEAFIIRNQFNDYLKILDQYKMTFAEVSDGSIDLNHDEKCEYIRKLAGHVTVLSEVGSKDVQKIIPPYKWIELMQAELNAGAWKVIGEAREGGNVGLFRSSGEVQQVWFIKLLNSNVNLGNISPNEVIPLETLRLGLRSDTFDFFLNKL